MTPAAVILPPAATAEMARRVAIPVGGVGAAGAFAGVLQLQHFAGQDGRLFATALVTGSMAASTGAMSMARTIRVPVAVSAGAPQRLHGDFGAVTLEILWWQVDLGRIQIDVQVTRDEDDVLGQAVREIGDRSGESVLFAKLLNTVLDLPR